MTRSKLTSKNFRNRKDQILQDLPRVEPDASTRSQKRSKAKNVISNQDMMDRLQHRRS